jgi:hypothetical protein
LDNDGNGKITEFEFLRFMLAQADVTDAEIVDSLHARFRVNASLLFSVIPCYPFFSAAALYLSVQYAPRALLCNFSFFRFRYFLCMSSRACALILLAWILCVGRSCSWRAAPLARRWTPTAREC